MFLYSFVFVIQIKTSLYIGHTSSRLALAGVGGSQNEYIFFFLVIHLCILTWLCLWTTRFIPGKSTVSSSSVEPLMLAFARYERGNLSDIVALLCHLSILFSFLEERNDTFTPSSPALGSILSEGQTGRAISRHHVSKWISVVSAVKSLYILLLIFEKLNILILDCSLSLP